MTGPVLYGALCEVFGFTATAANIGMTISAYPRFLNPFIAPYLPSGIDGAALAASPTLWACS